MLHYDRSYQCKQLISKLEMCPGDTDDSTIENLHILKNRSKKDIFFMNQGQSLWKPQNDRDHFAT